MATYTVSTSQNYTAVNGGTFNDYDRITINSGARLTIDTDTNIIERLLCITLWEAYITNTSTSTPIFVKFWENTTTNSQIRFEAGGIFTINGDWIDVGTSDGTSGQQFTLPQNASSESIPSLPTIFLFKDGETEPVIYNRVDAFTDKFWDEKFGTVFTHDPATNTITFWDGYNGFIPQNNAVVKIPNIICIDEALSTSYTDFDLATSGTLNIDKVIFGQNFAHNYSSASSVSVSNAGFDLAREDMNLGSQQSPSIANTGVLFQSGSHLINFAAANNVSIDNLFIYNIDTTSQAWGISTTNASGGIINNCRIVVENMPSATNRAVFNTTSPNLTYTNCFAATPNVWWYFSAWSWNSTVTDCWFNGAGKRNATEYSPYIISGINSSSVVINRLNSYPLDPLDGAVPANTYCFSLSTGSSNFTINDCDLYLWDNTTGSRTNNPIFSNGVWHRFNNIRLYGDHSSDTVNHSTASANTEVRNISIMNSEVSNADTEWTDGVIYDLVHTSDSMDTAPSASWKNVGTFHLYRTLNKDTGYLFKPMWSHDAWSSRFTEVSVSWSVFFNNAGSMYMDTAWDIVEFESDIHGGITWFTGVNYVGSTTANFTFEFALRTPWGTYGALQTLNTWNLTSALSALAGYDSNIWLQIKYRITRNVSNVTNLISNIRLATTIDPTYVSPFLLTPATLTIDNIPSGAKFIIYDNDALDPQELGTELLRDNSSSWEVLYQYDASTKWGDDIVLAMYVDWYKPLNQTVTLWLSDTTLTLNPVVETN